MKLKLSILTAILFTAIAGYGQNTILYQENFEGGPGTFLLNGPGPGSNTGTNMWTVNNTYVGSPNTMSEDSTFGGSISFAPFSKYLHIYDVPSSYTDCLYNPANQSDRFAYTTNDICTFTYNNVAVNFFYLCQGSATAYGTVYYSREGGPWTQCGALQYNNKYKWQYASITNAAFNNISGLRIGFRWQNNAGAGLDTSAFAIDDFSVVGTFDTVNYPPPHITTQVTPDTICAGGGVNINLTFTLSDSLCDGSYNITLFDSVNNFVCGWVATGYALVNGPYILPIPPNVLGNHCYHWRVDRSTPPSITGIATGCFYVENCPVTISTQQPLVTTDSLNPVCAGSVIKVPFFSTGTFGNTNVYWAELSDSAGNFTTYDSIASLPSNSAYPPPSPGMCTGQIPLTVKAGCNYYLRVVSDTPHYIGATYGPFCIQHCDIWTDSGQTSILACIKDCAKQPKGFNDSITYTINKYANNEHYLNTPPPKNQFEIQLLSEVNFAVLFTGPPFGAVTDTTSGKINLHVPCADSLCNLPGQLLVPPSFGGQGGSFYMRVIATHTNMQPDSMYGTLMFLNIGYPSDSLYISPQVPTLKYCVGGTDPTFYADPFNFCTYNQITGSNSVYTWYMNNAKIPGITGSGIGFLNYGVGSYTVAVRENNNGCQGNLATTVFTEIGKPSAVISGPNGNKLCIGDTGTYSVPFSNNVVYIWTVTHASSVDTANNVLKVKFDSAGTFTIKLTAIDSCGFATSSKSVTILPKPVPTISVPGPICNGSAVTLTAGGGGTYSWSPGLGLSCNTCSNPSADPTTTTQYTLTVANAACKVKDSVKVVVLALPADTACCSQLITSGESANISVAPASSNKETFVWTPANTLSCSTCTNPIASPTVTTTYTVTITDTADHLQCITVDSVTIYVKEDCTELFVPTAFSPNGDGQNDVLYAHGACLTNIDFKIYDRWGNKVFETSDLKTGWDGTFKGQPMNTGTYVYYLSAVKTGANATPVNKKGNISLIR